MSTTVKHRSLSTLKALAIDPKIYQARIDAKKRLVLRSPKFEYYEVHEQTNGSILLMPKILVDPFEISKRTLNSMDQSVENFRNGRVSAPINLSKPGKRVSNKPRTKKPRSR